MAINMSNWLDPSRPKIPSGGLFAIPDDILADIYTIWLRLDDVCRLDSALCSKIWRPPFLRLVSTKVIRFLREEIDVLDHILCTTTHKALTLPALEWILERGIHLASLRVRIVHHGISKEDEVHFGRILFALLNEGRLDKLETINFDRFSYYIKDADIAAILAKSYISMKSIVMHGCNISESSAAHIKRCTGLEAFAAYGKESVAELVEIVQSCRKIRKLNISRFFDKLTDESLQSVATHCRFIEHLNIEYCFAVSDAAIRRVAESCLNLQFVDLSWTKITDDSVVSFCKHCPQLKVILLNGCDLLTEAAIFAIAERLPGLTRIGLSEFLALTTTTVEKLVLACRDLEHISLGSFANSNIGNATLEKIAEHCSKLKELWVANCHDVTWEGLAAVAKTCVNLRTVRMNPKLHVYSLMLSVIFPHVSWSCG